MSSDGDIVAAPILAGVGGGMLYWVVATPGDQSLLAILGGFTLTLGLVTCLRNGGWV